MTQKGAYIFFKASLKAPEPHQAAWTVETQVGELHGAKVTVSSTLPFKETAGFR